MAAFTYLHYNPNTFELAFFSKTVTLHPLIYGFLIVVLIWVSINVTNCSDGVDGLCGTLSAVTLSTAYVLFRVFDIEPYFRHAVLLMIVCILGYLWFNASPSKLLMGDAGSRAIGIFIAFVFLKLHHPLLYIPVAIMLILDGGLGLIKVSFMRFLHINLMKISAHRFMTICARTKNGLTLRLSFVLRLSRLSSDWLLFTRFCRHL